MIDIIYWSIIILLSALLLIEQLTQYDDLKHRVKVLEVIISNPNNEIYECIKKYRTIKTGTIMKRNKDIESNLIDKDLMVLENDNDEIEISKYLVRKYFNKVGEDNV